MCSAHILRGYVVPIFKGMPMATLPFGAGWDENGRESGRGDERGLQMCNAHILREYVAPIFKGTAFRCAGGFADNGSTRGRPE